jgi:hypothetical protein
VLVWAGWRLAALKVAAIVVQQLSFYQPINLGSVCHHRINNPSSFTNHINQIKAKQAFTLSNKFVMRREDAEEDARGRFTHRRHRRAVSKGKNQMYARIG